MANTTKIDINIVEQKLLELINQFGIKIEHFGNREWSNNPDMLSFSFSPDKSVDIQNILRLQFFILKNSENNLFKFEISHCLSFDIEANKTGQFVDFINRLEIPDDLNEIAPNFDQHEFLRDFTRDELLAIEKYYPERARTFMMTEYIKLFRATATDRLEECIHDKRYFEPLRHYIWHKFISRGSWHLYLEELSYGHSEDWAELVASGDSERSKDDKYSSAFRSLKNRDWNSAMRNLRLNIRRRFANESDMFADKYFDMITGWTSNPLADTQSYISIYSSCIKEGRSHAFADVFAKGMISGNRAGDTSYWFNKAEKSILQKN